MSPDKWFRRQKRLVAGANNTDVYGGGFPEPADKQERATETVLEQTAVFHGNLDGIRCRVTGR